MLYLRTGLPGAGKTLNAIREIDIEHQADPNDPTRRLHKDPDNPDLPPRTIYFYGIPDLKADRLKSKWVEFETPEQWFDLPDGSVIVIDESQRVFGNDGTRARPEKITRFETHRHQGLDIHLITQHPSLLATAVRKLVGKHINFIRPYGREKGIFRHEYEFCIDNPEKRANFKQAQEEKVSLDPTYFGVYKSSTVHTHKPITPSYLKKLPLLIGLTMLPILLLVGMGYWLIKVNKDEMSTMREAPSEQQAAASPGTPQGHGQTLQPTARQGASGTVEGYVESRTPRIEELPSSAPVYDELTKPRDFPRPICAATEDQALVDKAPKRRQNLGLYDNKPHACQCYTQQMTRMATTFDFCMDVVMNGYFDDTKLQPQIASGTNMNGLLSSSPSQPAQPVAMERGRAAASPPASNSRLTIISDNSRTPRNY